MIENLVFLEIDFILVVEGQKFYVNKLVFFDYFFVFKIMFKSQFKESIVNEIELKDKKVEDVVEFLNCFYFGKNCFVIGI